MPNIPWQNKPSRGGRGGRSGRGSRGSGGSRGSYGNGQNRSGGSRGAMGSGQNRQQGQGRGGTGGQRFASSAGYGGLNMGYQGLPHPLEILRKEGSQVYLKDVTNGSVYRGWRSIVGIGGQVPQVAAAAGGTCTQTFTALEELVVQRMIVQASNAGNVVLTSLLHNNDQLISGNVPIEMFSADCEFGPALGHRVNLKDIFRAVFTNNDAALAASVSAGWECALGNPERTGGGHRGSPYLPALGSREYRSIIAIGCDAVQQVPIGGTVQLDFSIVEPAFLGHLILQCESNADPLMTVTSVKLDNDELLQGHMPWQAFRADSKMNPIFGHAAPTSHNLSVTVRNDSAALIDQLAGGFTAL